MFHHPFLRRRCGSAIRSLRIGTYPANTRILLETRGAICTSRHERLSFSQRHPGIRKRYGFMPLDLFDSRYIGAHEVLEQMWHGCTGERTGQRCLLQGLIQAAAFRLKVHQRMERPAKKLLNASLTKLRTAENTLGPMVSGVDIAFLRETLPLVLEDARWPTVCA